MISRIRRIAIAAAGAALMTFALCTSASAQVFFANPPCATVTILNMTGCPLNLHFITMPAVWPAVIAVPANGTATHVVPAGGILVNGITSFGGFFYPFLPPPPAAGVGCNATDFWIAHVRIGPVPCCVDICANPATCTMIIRPSPPPPMCNP